MKEAPRGPRQPDSPRTHNRTPSCARRPAWLGAAVKALGAVLTEIPTKENAMILTLLNAVHVPDMIGHTFSGHLLLRQAVVARETRRNSQGEGASMLLARRPLRAVFADSAEAAFYQNKIQAAICFAHRGLPLVGAQAVALRAGEWPPWRPCFRR